MLTSYQITLSTNATNAQNIYNAEKDFLEIFTAAGNSREFQECFGDRSLSNARLASSGCFDKDARKQFFDILRNYRILKIMVDKSAMPFEYYAFRLTGFCPYAQNENAKDEMEQLAERNQLDAGLSADIRRICKI